MPADRSAAVPEESDVCAAGLHHDRVRHAAGSGRHLQRLVRGKWAERVRERVGAVAKSVFRQPRGKHGGVSTTTDFSLDVLINDLMHRYLIVARS